MVGVHVNEIRKTAYIQFFFRTLILAEEAEIVCIGIRFMTLPTAD